MSALVMPPNWQDRVRAMLRSESQTDELVKRCEGLRGQLKRLNYQFEQGLIEEADIAEYQKKAQKLIREINSIVISDANQTVDFCTHALGFASTWHKSDQQQRHAILKEIFDAIYVNTHTRQIVGVKPYIEFVPMFRQTQLVENEGRFVLKNEEAALDGQLPVWNGRDGIRTRGLCLDRAAC